MLFDFKIEQPVAFWMKNTYVSLDMIFIRKPTAASCRSRRTPSRLSERVVPSGGPVRGVLEVVAGTAKKLGITAGDRVAHRIFSAGNKASRRVNRQARGSRPISACWPPPMRVSRARACALVGA